MPEGSSPTTAIAFAGPFAASRIGIACTRNRASGLMRASAFNAVASICRHPDAFKLAIAMSGTFDLSKYLDGKMNQDFYFSSPVHYLPGLDEGPQLAQLRKRFVLIPTGEGDYEDPAESWRIANVLGAKSVPNRVDLWGRDYHHNWVTWRAMLPKYLDELLR